MIWLLKGSWSVQSEAVIFHALVYVGTDVDYVFDDWLSSCYTLSRSILYAFVPNIPIFVMGQYLLFDSLESWFDRLKASWGNWSEESIFDDGFCAVGDISADEWIRPTAVFLLYFDYDSETISFIIVLLVSGLLILLLYCHLQV